MNRVLIVGGARCAILTAAFYAAAHFGLGGIVVAAVLVTLLTSPVRR